MCKYKCIDLFSTFLERGWGVKNRKTRNRLVHMDQPALFLLGKCYPSYPSFIPSTSSIILILNSSGARTESLRPWLRMAYMRSSVG